MSAEPVAESGLAARGSRPTSERIRRRSPRPVLALVHSTHSGDASPPAKLLVSMLEEAGYQVRYRSSRKAWQETLQSPVDLVVAAGGDGTVGKVASELLGRDLPLAILPFGTANNVAKALGIMAEGDAESLARSWLEAPLQAFDVWQVSADGRDETFIESIGGGIIGQTMVEADALEPPTLILGNEIDRARHLLRRAVAGAGSARWGVMLDGEDLSGDYVGVEALNIRSVGPNVPLSTNADASDGALDVVLIRGADRDALERRLVSLAMAREPEALALPVRRGRELVLLPPEGAPLHLDGSAWDGFGLRGAELHIKAAGRIRIVAPPIGPFKGRDVEAEAAGTGL